MKANMGGLDRGLRIVIAIIIAGLLLTGTSHRNVGDDPGHCGCIVLADKLCEFLPSVCSLRYEHTESQTKRVIIRLRCS